MGAGAKRKKHAGVSHRSRQRLAARHPVHVTMKLRRGLPALRCRDAYEVLAHAFDKARSRAGRLERGEFRLVHYSVQNDHFLLICEAQDRLSLSRGIQGLAVRVAKALNRLWNRTGKLFADRYHDRVLRSPKEVRNALRYVLNNARKHGSRWSPKRPDPFSSGSWFDGWSDWSPNGPTAQAGPIMRAGSWLLRVGWRHWSPIGLTEAPATA